MDNKKTVQNKHPFARHIRDAISAFIAHYITIVGTPQQRRDTINQRLNYAARGLAFAVLAFFFSRAAMPFSAYPLGAALLCASPQYILFIYVALITGAVFNVGSALAMFLVYTMGLLMRFIITYSMKEKHRGALFSESIGYKILTSVTMMFMLGVYRCVSGGFLWYDLIGTALSMVLAPAFVFLFCGGLVDKNRFTSYHDLGVAALMACAVYSLSGFSLFGFSLSAIAAFTLSLYISKECGMLRGGVIGLICGLAYNIMYAPLFALAGLISGLFWKVGTIAASGAALAVGVVYGIYMDGFSTLREFAPDLLAGSLIFTPLAKFGLLPRPTMYSGSGSMPDNYSDTIAVTKEQQQATTVRFKAMSDALTSLSDIFYKLSNAQKKPELSEVHERCEKCFESYCEKCHRHVICWDEHYSDTVDAINKIAIEMYRGGVATTAVVPDYVSSRCNRMSEIIKEINRIYSRQLEDALKSNKAEIFAIDYAAMSKLLEEAMSENAREYEIDETLTQRLKSSARYLNLTSSNLAVYGRRRKSIIVGGVDLARVKLGVDEIRRSFERVCRVPLEGPNFSVEGGYITMSLASARQFKCEFSRATLKKEDEDINGDSITFFENNEDYFYSLLSDGMGSGKDAALSSRLTGVYLDRMLRAGNRKAQAIEMLNSFLRQKNQESFATLDLLEVDLLCGEASFVKSGAAPSYVLRGTSLFKIASKSMPIGITKEINAEEVNFKLEDGDVIVMTSDGIAQSFEDGLWLADMLTNDWRAGVTPAQMCEKILDEARERSTTRDDMTVGMVRITKI